MRGGHEVVVVITSNFNPLGEKWEIDVFKEEFNSTAPWLEVRTYKETNDTLGQVDRAFELAREMDAEVVFVSAWLQYPRVRYLVRGRESLHFGAFGIPHPVFAFADPIFMIIFPVLDLFGLGPWFQAAIVRRRECGKI